MQSNCNIYCIIKNTNHIIFQMLSQMYNSDIINLSHFIMYMLHIISSSHLIYNTKMQYFRYCICSISKQYLWCVLYSKHCTPTNYHSNWFKYIARITYVLQIIDSLLRTLIQYAILEIVELYVIYSTTRYCLFSIIKASNFIFRPFLRVESVYIDSTDSACY